METFEDIGAARSQRVWGTAGGFLAVAFAAAGALGAVQQAAGVPAEVIQLAQFGPAAGVAALALVQRDRVARLVRGAGRSGAGRSGAGRSGAGRSGAGRSGAGRGAALLATAPLITVLAILAYLLVQGGTADGWFTRPGSLEHSFALIVVAQLVGACAEELGWRCLLQPLLRTRFGVLASSVAVGVLWGLWHVPVFAQRPQYAAAFLAATVAMSVVLGLALEGTGGARRLLLAGGFHTLVNLGMLLFLDEESGAVLPMVCFGSACLLAALPWVMRTPSGAGSAAATLHRT
ncbi:CPBP family intramembrane metalloprotease [Streptomyces sp. NBC_00555]|uniref:CPBP family intramembrane glutamic endopeptidase n=1 Tax=Streptomyces sp. NBC_00555 TaxID=2903662 RepID=UPI002252FACF|nr:CPBP family intramembrane glutamic endopeptidase [Streptomyces sp. NBC_00555]MCX5015581.1 CPBP family intramembrane metalloprotease [Streptomyces sp. NBC_00555]